MRPNLSFNVNSCSKMAALLRSWSKIIRQNCDLCHSQSSNSCKRLQIELAKRWKSTNVQTAAQEHAHKENTDTSLKVRESQTPQVALKKVQKKPFVKELFLGRFNQDMLIYPEVLDPERLESLNEMLRPIETFFEQKVDSKKIDEDGKIPDDVLAGLKELGLFGLTVPTEYGGLGLNATEYGRVCEYSLLDGGIGTTLVAHQSIGTKGILMAGTEAQKVKYLGMLAQGSVAAFCLTEPSCGSDVASIKCKATLSDDKKHYLLNGTKIFITNGGIADVLTVFAKTVDDTDAEKITGFIVERGFGGITNGPPEDKLGIKGSNTCTLYFDNTPVPVENVLGELHGGFQLALNILNTGRFSMGSGISAILKRLTDLVADHAINRVQFGKPLKDYDLIKEKFAKMACDIYAMESMAYMTASIIDFQEQSDFSLEAAIVKVFSSEAGWRHASECLQILGGLGYMKSMPVERALRDVRISMIFEGTNEILRMLIALSGCQYAGKELAESVRKLRNPLLFPGFVFSKIWQRRRQAMDSPTRNLALNEHLHPSLQKPAELLEYSVLRFQYAVEIALGKYARHIMEKQMVLERLSNIVIDLYAMTASLSRASRSYCIGLPNATHEIMLAKTFCYDAGARVKQNVEDVLKNEFDTNDLNYTHIADHIFKNKGYCASHPLSRMWS